MSAMRRPLGFFAMVSLAALALPAAANAQVADLKWNVEGYYRTRGVWLTNLAPEPRYVTADITMPNIRNTTYLTQRLRLSPQLTYGNIAKLFFEVNAVDDVLWGDNNAISTAPLFAVNGSNQYYLGGPEKDSVAVSRAWVEFQIPVGVMRVGRMPSHWGMGILANGGGSGNWDPLSPVGEPRRKVQDYYFDDDFGDNHFGSTNDRILFATRPITILKTIQKKADTTSNFVVAYAYDKLSEAPILTREDDRTIRPFGQQGFVSRGADEDDVQEHVFVVAYSNPDWDQVAFTDELKVGTYQVIRTQSEGFTNPSMVGAGCMDGGEQPCHDEGSLVWIADFWYRLRYGPWYSEAEFVHIAGETTGGVPFPAPNLKKTASIDGFAGRVGYMTELWDVIFEGGYSSGDANLGDGTFSQRALHPDYNVGLILFEDIVRERTARVFGPNFIGSSPPDGAKGFMSFGGVIDAWYLHPKVRWRPADWGLEVIGAAVIAFVDEWGQSPNVFIKPNDSDSKLLGTEIDLAIKSRFADGHMDVSLETGYLMFGDVLKTRTAVAGSEIPDAPSGAFSLQARVAYIF
jgi:hypothetical protein